MEHDTDCQNRICISKKEQTYLLFYFNKRGFDSEACGCVSQLTMCKSLVRIVHSLSDSPSMTMEYHIISYQSHFAKLHSNFPLQIRQKHQALQTHLRRQRIYNVRGTVTRCKSPINGPTSRHFWIQSSVVISFFFPGWPGIGLCEDIFH